jgi:hypothetical protein
LQSDTEIYFDDSALPRDFQRVFAGLSQSRHALQQKRLDTRFPGIHHFDEIMPEPDYD